MKRVLTPVSFRRTGARWHGEKGAGRLKSIFWLLILITMAYVGFKVIPVLVTEYQFEDNLQTIAQFASAQRRSIPQIRDDVMSAADKDDVPVQPEDVKVVAPGGNVRINVEYSVTVDLSVYQWTLNFHPSSQSNALY